MVGRLSTLLCVALVVLLSAGAMAATWTKVGASGFTTTPGLMQDEINIVLNSVVVDDLGNVYATANNGNNTGGGGGVTIFKPGSTVNVDVNALGFPGCVTKLVKGGDGKVYGLQNWSPVGSPNPTLQPMRVIRINLTGTVDLIWDAGPQFAPVFKWILDPPDGDPGVVVDLGGGNNGLQMGGPTSTFVEFYENIGDIEGTLATSFRMDSFAVNAEGNNLVVATLTVADAATGAPSPSIAIKNVAGVPHFCFTNGGDEAILADLGAAATGVFHTASMYVNGNTDTVKLIWDGTEAFSGVVSTALTGTGTGWPEWGAANNWGDHASTCQVTFDWLGYGSGDIPVGGTYSLYLDGSGVPHTYPDKPSGLTVGADGNVYWTSAANGTAGRTHFFWRYDVTSQAVEEAPTAGVNQGKGENHKLVDLEYVGNGQFAVIGNEASNAAWSFDSKWRIDSMSWESERKSGAATDPAIRGRTWATATAFDPLRLNLWAGGWSYGPITNFDPPSRTTNRMMTSGNVWWNIGTLWPTGPSTASIADLGDGNKGIQMIKMASDPGGNHMESFRVVYEDLTWAPANSGRYPWLGVNNPTLALRFKIDAYSSLYKNVPFALLVPRSYGGWGETTPEVGIAIADVGGTDHFVLENLGGTGGRVLADLGPVATGVWNEVYLHAESAPAGAPKVVRVWWNGVEATVSPVLEAECRVNPDCEVEFGLAPGRKWNLGSAKLPGSATIVYDWLAVGRGLIQPADPVKGWDYYFDGSRTPLQKHMRAANVASLYKGSQADGGLFDASGAIAGSSHFFVNDRNPQTLLGPLDEHHWVTGLAVNPVTGAAWMGLGSVAGYTGSGAGHVITRNVAMGIGDEGVPEPGAQVVALAITGGKAYAVTCNMTSGAYSLYTTVIPPVVPMSVAQAKKGPAGILVTTDVPKVVTYPMFAFSSLDYYIEDSDRCSGIKVIPKDPNDVPLLGSKVTVSGFLDVINGEAVINGATAVSALESGVVKPLAMTIKSLGGKALGAQPATTPAYGLNNVGLLVRVAGKFSSPDSGITYLLDDGSGNKVQVMYDLGNPAGGYAAVTGICIIDPTSTAPNWRVSIMPRDYTDIDTFTP